MSECLNSEWSGGLNRVDEVYINLTLMVFRVTSPGGHGIILSV